MRTFITTLVIATLTACGGGGGDDPATPQEQAAELLTQQRTLYAQMVALCPGHAMGPCPSVPAQMHAQFDANSDRINELWPVPQSVNGASCYDMTLVQKVQCINDWQTLSGRWLG